MTDEATTSKSPAATVPPATDNTPSRRQRSVPRWLRIMVPAVLILVWLAAAGVGGPYFGRVSEVASNDPTAYLPSSSDAAKVQASSREFNDSDAIPAIVVFTSETPLTEDDLATLTVALQDAVTSAGSGLTGSPVIPSEDSLAAQAFVTIPSSLELRPAVEQLGDALRSDLPDSFSVYLTGPAGFSANLGEAFSGVDGLLLLVALGAVFVILILVYRSLLLPVAVLTTSLFALCVALLTVWWLAKWEVLALSGQTQGILFILVIGAATDYSLLVVARYREELRIHKDKLVAARKAVRGSVEPIVASGGTVIAGLLTLLLSDLKSNSALGPVASIGIIFAMLAALTLLPAILYAFGRKAFWPRTPKFEPAVVAAEQGMPRKGVWYRIAQMIKKRPRQIWIGTTVVLLIGAIGATQLNAVGVPQSDLILGSSEARDGQVALGEHFPGGSGSPALVVVDQGEMGQAVSQLLAQDGVDSVSAASQSSPSGSVQVTADGPVAMGPPGTPAPEPTVLNGQVLLQATLTNAADSETAGDTVRDIRAGLANAAPSALVGGATATAVDTNAASIHDRNLIIPVVLVVITLILMALLRSVVAPLLLVVTTVISFGTALGVSALFFNNVFKFPGADPSVPLYAFIFLVALGIDYNIFLMTRVREEALKHGTRAGVLRGLTITGGVITSAGLVLAATFAALGVLPILFLVQIAFIVAFGVLLDTLVVRTLLVPALAYDIGPAVWWPSKLSKAKD